MQTDYTLWAVLLGGLSAISLPLGAWAGVRFRPRPGISALLGAFGAGFGYMVGWSVPSEAPTKLPWKRCRQRLKRRSRRIVLPLSARRRISS